MTDPVDTDALRTALLTARPAIENAIGWAEHEGAGPDSDEREAIDAMLNGQSAAADEVDRLRAVIEGAPHAPQCQAERFHFKDYSLSRCTCWKADAL